MSTPVSGFRIAIIGATLMASLAFAATASAQSRCLAGKNQCFSKKLAALYKCHIIAETIGVPPDPACLAKADAKFMACFAKMDFGVDCLTTGDGAAIEAKADAFTLDVVAELDPTAPAPNPCAAKKKKCVLKKLAGILKCFATAGKKGVPVVQKCVDKLRAKFDGTLLFPPDPSKGCFEKIEAKGGCTTLDDTKAIEAKIDSFIEDVLCELGQAPQMCVLTDGDDVWITPAGSNQDFSGNPIPANFFDPNSDPFSGLLTLRGIPLTTTPPNMLGSVDTIVRRLSPATLPRLGNQTTVPIEIVALSLTSVNPITVTYNGGLNPEPWNVRVNLSSAAPQQQGPMTIRREAAEGGTYDSSLPVIPKFTFTRVSDSAVRTLDCGLGGCGPILVLQVAGASWTATGLIGGYDPSLNEIDPVPSVGVDGDGNGSPDVTTNNNPDNYVPGVDPNSRACELNEHLTVLAGHGVQIDCEDHYVLYDATGSAGPPFVDLDDQFGPPEIAVPLGPVIYFMVPAQKVLKGSGGAALATFAHPDVHQVCYDLPASVFASTVVIENQLANQTINVIAGPRFLAVPSQKAIGPLPPPIRLDVNHFECYTATGPPPGASGKVYDQFGVTKASLGNVLFFCNPVDKNGELILDGEMHLTCYQWGVKTVNQSVNTRNQFGAGTANVVNTKAFCVPTHKVSHAP